MRLLDQLIHTIIAVFALLGFVVFLIAGIIGLLLIWHKDKEARSFEVSDDDEDKIDRNGNKRLL